MVIRDVRIASLFIEIFYMNDRSILGYFDESYLDESETSVFLVKSEGHGDMNCRHGLVVLGGGGSVNPLMGSRTKAYVSFSYRAF